MVRNLAVRAFALPWLGKPFWARSLHDDFTLPDYNQMVERALDRHQKIDVLLVVLLRSSRPEKST